MQIDVPATNSGHWLSQCWAVRSRAPICSPMWLTLFRELRLHMSYSLCSLNLVGKRYFITENIAFMTQMSRYLQLNVDNSMFLYIINIFLYGCASVMLLKCYVNFSCVKKSFVWHDVRFACEHRSSHYYQSVM